MAGREGIGKWKEGNNKGMVGIKGTKGMEGTEGRKLGKKLGRKLRSQVVR